MMIDPINIVKKTESGTFYLYSD